MRLSAKLKIILNILRKAKKYMISNPTSKFKKTSFPELSQIRSIWSVFGQNRTGTGSEQKWPDRPEPEPDFRLHLFPVMSSV